MKYGSIFYLFIFLVVSSFFIIACSDVKTPTGQAIKEPVKEVETKPTQSEQIQEPKEEKPSCSDECSTDTCDGFSYVSCLSGKDGCKYTQNKGLVKGKCGVECVQDSNCGINQNCESYKCKTEERKEDLMEETKIEEAETSSTLDSWNKLIEDAKKQLEETMNKCNAPFKCSSNCAQYLDVGQKDCPSGQVCCLTKKSEVEEQEATETLIDTSEQKVYSSLEKVYTTKNPIGHNVRLQGIGLKIHAVSSEDFFLFTDDERVMNNPNYIAYGAEYDIVIYNNPKIYVQQKIINITGTVVNCERKEDGKYCINAESIEIVDEFVNA